ncbi:murein biosynthesis integral membrane protein MurJ [Tissierella sp.]|uniref:murein biosynthesis integral membrane protein MurJ n=1 Tax=Tissierella sp. TaxID=41274 RepID=UPI00286637A6|nr:murein biosynthesis integral membrane protein MurJ [Tissierella sp.]MDR7857533.1 murein biosynthesis integral membrane protein MurJ [Tissierella sp.]
MTNKSNKAAKSILIMIIFTLGSKLLGFLREVLIASKFGSGMETDTFFVALTATSLVTGFLSSSISTTFIPILSEIESKEGKKGKIEHTNNMINVIFVISAILVMLGWLGSPIIVKLLAKGFEGEQFDLAVQLTRIGLPMILFSGIIGVMSGFLQSEEKFTSTSAIGFPFNFVYIFFLLFLSSTFGIKGLMVAGVIAVASQFLIQIPEARSSGYKYNFKFDLKDKHITKVVLLSLPVLVGVAINDLNAIIDRTLASDLVSGSISALNYANRLNNLILGVFITAITTVIFPMLAKESNSDNYDSMKKIMGYGINIILLITIPATVGLIVLATPIVEIAFQRGAFDAMATFMTSQALIFYSTGLVAMALRLLLTRVYYSLQDTKTPMINGALSVGLNIVLNLILVKFMAHSGLALATSIATSIATIIMIYGLRKKIGPMGIKSYIVCGLKSGLASGVMGLVAYMIYHGMYGALGSGTLYNLMSLLVAVGVGVVVYLVLCYLFKVEEIRMVVKKIKDKSKR